MFGTGFPTLGLRLFSIWLRIPTGFAAKLLTIEVQKCFGGKIIEFLVIRGETLCREQIALFILEI